MILSNAGENLFFFTVFVNRRIYFAQQLVVASAAFHFAQLYICNPQTIFY